MPDDAFMFLDFSIIQHKLNQEAIYNLQFIFFKLKQNSDQKIKAILHES